MKKRLIHLALLGILTLACNLPFQITFDPPTAPPTEPPSDLALTVTAQAQLLTNINNTNTPQATPIQSDQSANPPANTPISLPTLTPTIAASPTPNGTETPSIPIISVSLDTNCRTGPGQAYDIVGALLVGESTEVTGKNTSSGYWIVKNPDKPISTCWLWGEYATVTGNQSSLAEVSIPPTPTPSIPAAPSNLKENSICYPQNQIHIYDGTLTWHDNSNNEDGFRIYRRDDGIPNAADVLDGTVGPNVTSYQFSVGHFKSGQTVLKVEAFNSAGTSSRPAILINVGNCP